MKPSKIQSDVDNYQTEHKYKFKYLYNTNVMNAKKTNKPKNLNECVQNPQEPSRKNNTMPGLDADSISSILSKVRIQF